MKKVGWSSILVATLVLVSGVAADAQQPKKIPRIGYLVADPGAPTRESFRQGLRDFGYVEGQSINIEWRFTEDKPDRFSEFAVNWHDSRLTRSSQAAPLLSRFSSVRPLQFRSS